MNAAGKWVNVKDRLPPETGTYLVAYHWPGHGGIWYVRSMPFLHTAYEARYMRWYDDKIAPHITHWAPIHEPPEGGEVGL